MYGIIIEGIHFMITDMFGEPTWTECLVKAKLKEDSFCTHDRYSEKIVGNLIAAVAEVTGKTHDEVGRFSMFL